MKEASGDMVMTIVVIVGVVAVLAIARGVIWPFIQDKITEKAQEINYVEVIDNYNI